MGVAAQKKVWPSVSEISIFFADLANFWRDRSRLYQNEVLQENMRLTAFFKLYKMCTLLHRCDLKILANFLQIMLRNLQNFAEFQKL